MQAAGANVSSVELVVLTTYDFLARFGSSVIYHRIQESLRPLENLFHLLLLVNSSSAMAESPIFVLAG